MAEPVPSSMSAARLLAFGAPPRVEIRSLLVPEPGPAQVLVRLSMAAVNASDLRACRTGAGFRRPLPTTPGLAGVGRVVAVGSGWMGSWLVGRRVAVLGSPKDGGTWAPYVVTDVRRCLPLADGVRDAAAALGLQAAVSAVSALQELRVGKRHGLVLTAPDLPVSAATLSVARQRGVPLVVVARDPAEAARVAPGPGLVVVDGSAADAEAQVRRESRAIDARVVLDAGGGGLLGRLLAALPDGSEGVLVDEDAQPVRLEAADLVLRGKVVRGLSWERAPEGPDPRGIGRWAGALETRLREVDVPAGPGLSLADLPAILALDPGTYPPGGRWLDLRGVA